MLNKGPVADNAAVEVLGFSAIDLILILML
jgi:hypothetical protein